MAIDADNSPTMVQRSPDETAGSAPAEAFPAVIGSGQRASRPMTITAARTMRDLICFLCGQDRGTVVIGGDDRESIA
jgi:hypothetical protein